MIRDCGGYLEGKKRMLPYLILLLLVYGVAVLFYRNQQFLDCVTFLLWKIGTPFVVGVPVLLCLTGERKKHNKKVRVLVLVCFLFGCLFLQGCNVAELEDKAFPVLLNIRDQDDFQNVWLNHEYAGNKEVDYNHLKVVLIERSFLEKEAEVEDMLSMLEQEKEVPWNAYVMTTESCDRLAQTEGELDVLLGNYLEELLENTSGIDQKAYPTLGMLYEERVNHLETLYIPFVDIEGEQSGAVEDDTEKSQITAYEVWKRGRAGGACRYGYRACSILHAELCGRLHLTTCTGTLCESGCSFLPSQRNGKNRCRRSDRAGCHSDCDGRRRNLKRHSFCK